MHHQSAEFVDTAPLNITSLKADARLNLSPVSSDLTPLSTRSVSSLLETQKSAISLGEAPISSLGSKQQV